MRPLMAWNRRQCLGVVENDDIRAVSSACLARTPAVAEL